MGMTPLCITALTVTLRYWRMRAGNDIDTSTSFRCPPYIATVERNCKALKEKLTDALGEL